MTTWDEEVTPTVPHVIPYRAPVVMPGIHPRLSTPGSVRSTTPLGGTGLAQAPAGTIQAPGTTTRPRVDSPGPSRVSKAAPPLPSRLIRIWPRLSPENRALVEAVALALLPPAEDASRR